MSRSIANPRVPGTHAGEPARAPARRGGALPWVVLACATGVAATSAGDALARTGHGGGTVLFWFAVAVILLPATLRLTATVSSPG